MASLRRKVAVVVFLAVASVGLLAQPAAANHEDAIVSCGDTGTFTLKTQPTGAGFGAPLFSGVLLFEGGGTLSILRVTEDGVLVWDPAATGMASNAVEEVTCSFTLRNGVFVVITGVYTPGP